MGKRENVIMGGLNALLGEGDNRQESASTKTEFPESVQKDEQRPEQAELSELPEDDPEEEATPEEEEDLINSIEDEELREALHRKRMEKRGRPRKEALYRQKESELYVRTTFIMSREQLAKLREISFRETITMKDIITEIVGEAIKAYEKKNGKLHPKDHRGDPSKIFK